MSVHSSTIHNSQKVQMSKQPKRLSTDEWINKMWYRHSMECYSAIKKEWSTDSCNNLDEPENVVPSERS